MNATYKAWKDAADNIGIQCSVCGRLHWLLINPILEEGVKCPNCEILASENVLVTERAKHIDETEDCIHDSTQTFTVSPKVISIRKNLKDKLLKANGKERDRLSKLLEKQNVKL